MRTLFLFLAALNFQYVKADTLSIPEVGMSLSVSNAINQHFDCSVMNGSIQVYGKSTVALVECELKNDEKCYFGVYISRENKTTYGMSLRSKPNNPYSKSLDIEDLSEPNFKMWFFSAKGLYYNVRFSKLN